MPDFIDFLPDAILAIDIDGKVITWNQAMEKMTGASAADMIGKGNYEYALPFYGITEADSGRLGVDASR